MVHAVKCKTEYFEPVVLGQKKFEVRKNDREYRTGDILALNEIDKNNKYTGQCALFKITYILDNAEYLAPGFVGLSLKPLAISVTSGIPTVLK